MLHKVLQQAPSFQIEGLDPNGKAYTGTVSILPDGEAFRLSWSLSTALGAFARSGVGIAFSNTLYVARSFFADNADANGFPGIVRYDISEFGNFPAKWYHPELNGEVGDGLSTDGPMSTISGSYTADYSSDGGDFPTLTKHIASQNGRYSVEWRQSGALLYNGVAFAHGDELISAWAKPPREDLVVLRLCLDGKHCLSGTWFDLVSDNGSSGTETYYLA